MKLPVVYAALLLLAACSDTTSELETGKPKSVVVEKQIATYPLSTDERWTTLKKTWTLTEAPGPTQSDIYTGLFQIDQLPLYESYGLSDLRMGPGEPHRRYTNLATEATAPTVRRSLLYFAQFSDLHIIDEESPVRLEGVTRIAFASAFRPQDHLTTQLVDSVFQSMNAFSFEDRPFDFAFTTGDVSDNVQENEITWVRQLFDGEVIWPDSGAVDDPIPGPGNDFTDPFQAAGLDKRVPWYMLFGNHDQAHLGTFNTTQAIAEAAVGDRVVDLWNLDAFTGGEMTFGARDASQPFAPVLRTGAKVVPDSRRKMVTPREFMSIFVSSATEPKGHGFTEQAVAEGQTSYAVRPVEGFPLTLVALDTVMETVYDAKGNIIQSTSAEGEISRAMMNEFIKPALDEAQNRGDLIVVSSHHCSESIQDGVSEVKKAEFRQILLGYPNVIAHLCGHGHRSRLWFWSENSDRGYPELMQASAIDFPIQGRILELVDNTNGTFSLFTTQVEPNVGPSGLAYEALTYAAAAYNFAPISLFPKDWYEDVLYRNVEVVIPVPPGFDPSALIGKPQIESLTRLAE